MKLSDKQENIIGFLFNGYSLYLENDTSVKLYSEKYFIDFVSKNTLQSLVRKGLVELIKTDNRYVQKAVLTEAGKEFFSDRQNEIKEMKLSNKQESIIEKLLDDKYTLYLDYNTTARLYSRLYYGKNNSRLFEDFLVDYVSNNTLQILIRKGLIELIKTQYPFRQQAILTETGKNYFKKPLDK